MTARRVSDSLNSHVQYWSECVYPTAPDRRGRPIGETRHPDAPPRWAPAMRELLREVKQRKVGRALVRHVRRRATIYFAPDDPATQPDSFADLGDSTLFGAELLAQARRGGAPAAIFVDPTARPRLADTGLIKTADITLAHELAHAVRITHGGYLYQPSTSMTEAYDVSSEEEGFALVLENMYRSEARLSLRHTYLGNQPRRLESDPQDTMARVLEDYAVMWLRHDVPALANELEQLTEAEVPFNPFRRDRRERAAALRTSRRRAP